MEDITACSDERKRLVETPARENCLGRHSVKVVVEPLANGWDAILLGAEPGVGRDHDQVETSSIYCHGSLNLLTISLRDNTSEQRSHRLASGSMVLLYFAEKAF